MYKLQKYETKKLFFFSQLRGGRGGLAAGAGGNGISPKKNSLVVIGFLFALLLLLFAVDYCKIKDPKIQ